MTVANISKTHRTRHAILAGRALILMLLLLIIEGALRKWVSSGLTVPLIGLRDILAAASILYAWRWGFLTLRKSINILLCSWVCVVFAWGAIQLLLGQSSPLLLAIGLRFWCLYLAFGIAIGQMMDRDGFRIFLKVSLWTIALLAPLVIIQFLSPQGAFINRQVDGDEATVFTSALGIVRTTGTFSFTLGFTTLLGLLTPLALGCFMEYRNLLISGRLATAGLIGIAIGSSVSGSRAAIIFFGIMILASTFSGLLIYKGLTKKKALAMLAGAIFFTVISTALLPDIVASMQARFEQASDSEDFLERIATIFIGDRFSHEITTWLGMGIGSGSALASYVSTGERMFLAGEAESGRILAEGGVAGGIFILLKVVLSMVCLVRAIRMSFLSRSALPTLVWCGFLVALFTWPATLQLTSHGIFAIYVAIALLVLRRNIFTETRTLAE